MNFDKEFDASGLSCPLPILKTKKALADMASGQVLKLIATDCGAVKDMQAFADHLPKAATGAGFAPLPETVTLTKPAVTAESPEHTKRD